MEPREKFKNYDTEKYNIEWEKDVAFKRALVAKWGMTIGPVGEKVAREQRKKWPYGQYANEKKEHRYASGYIEFKNLNADSTHPNPWKPPSPWEQHYGARAGNIQYMSCYNIWKSNPWVKWGCKDFAEGNTLSTDGGGPFTDRLALWTWRGFLVGCVASTIDIVYVTRSLKVSTNIARFLYITPVVTSLPVSWIVSREFLAGYATRGQNAHWINLVSALAPATIWGIFRNRAMHGIRVFAVAAGWGLLHTLNHDTGGILHWVRYNLRSENDPGNWQNYGSFHNDWKYRIASEYVLNNSPEPTWKKFVDEDTKTKF